MDTHLPYSEPAAYRYRYAVADPPGKLGERFERNAVMRARPKTPPERKYVEDRYDNNIAYIHDELERVFSSLRDEDIVVIFSDHGEEFWDHTGFEHGHTLFDELLRIPLVIRAPGLTPRRVEEPVSLLDLTPTVLALLGLPVEGLDGTSLVAVARGDAGAPAALASRDLGFGRPLYGGEQWGALHKQMKYTTTEGREALYDLDSDPAESENLLKEADNRTAAEWRAYLGQAVEMPVELGYRLSTSRSASMPTEDLVAELLVPGGVRDSPSPARW
jgi:arylsulfatase A-like enzyme